MKLFFILLFTGCYFLFSPAVPAFAQADFSCQTIYGGGQTCESVGGLVLDNTVMNPKTNKMVNNLGSSDPRYEPGSMVVLQIKLTNTSGSTFQEVDVKDMLPPYVNFMGGDGNFDEATKTLSFRVSGLKPNEPKIYNVLGRIVDASQLPGVRSVSCVANIATAAVVDPASAKDTAQFCIEKKPAPTPASTSTSTPTPTPTPAANKKDSFPILSPTPLKKTPATGPQMLNLAFLISTGFSGWLLKNLTKKTK